MMIRYGRLQGLFDGYFIPGWDEDYPHSDDVLREYYSVSADRAWAAVDQERAKVAREAFEAAQQAIADAEDDQAAAAPE